MIFLSSQYLREKRLGLFLKFFDPCDFTMPSCSDIHLEVLTLLFSADLLTRHFKQEQSLVSLLATFPFVILDDDLTMGFSGYQKEKCHEEQHGQDTCGSFRSKYDKCLGKHDEAYYLSSLL